MEKIYSKERSVERSLRVRPEVIKFLMDYSKSLHYVNYGDYKFETNLN